MTAIDPGPAGNEVNPRGIEVHLEARAQSFDYEEIADDVAAAVKAGGPGSRILDWGCGFGQMTDLLTARGLDAEPFDFREDLEHDGRYTLSHYPQYEAYLSSEPVALPYDDASFDAVLSCGVLEHVEFPQASLAEVRRVLRPGGRLFVFKLPNRRSWLEKVAKRAGLYYHGRWPNDRVYTLDSARGIVAGAGFEVEQARLFGLLPMTLTHPIAQRFGKAIWVANKALSRVPGLRVLATNIDVRATAPAASSHRPG